MPDYKTLLTVSLLKIALTGLSLVLFSGTVFTQSTNNRFFSSGSEIVADVLPGNDIYVSHPCDKGITIYNLAEIFQVNAASVLALNKLSVSNPLNSSRIVKIPLQKKLIRHTRGKNTPGVNPVPVYYIAKKGESLYRIAKTYFEGDLENIKSINNKKDSGIREGEKLLVGWYLTKIPQAKENRSFPSAGEKADKQLNQDGNVGTTESKNVSDEPSVIKYYISDVIGLWDKNRNTSSSFFVLHNEARIGSTIDVYNPMLRRHVKAKVIGRVPASLYSEEIQIILSGATARELGILDGRFKVNIKFEK